MQNLARQNYLQAEVHTATPQKLQLMLVEAAIKNIHRTKKAWEEEKFEVGLDSLSLAQDIVAEILSSLDKEGNPDLAGKIASIYVFIFRCLAIVGRKYGKSKLCKI
jgi:flagellar protein FliS